MAASVSGNQYDPNTRNNSATYTELVAPSVNVAVGLAASTQTVVAGHSLTFTASIRNTGPNPATSVVFSVPMAPGILFNSAAASAGSASFVEGQLVAQLGELNPGDSAQVSFVVTPETPGTITPTASIQVPQNQLDPASLTASTTVTVLESPGELQFSDASDTVANNAGFAAISVVRAFGSLGVVTVNYQTVAVNATPGVDFVPTSGTLTFASGQTVGTIDVPVINDEWENHDDTVDLVLSAPAGVREPRLRQHRPARHHRYRPRYDSARSFTGKSGRDLPGHHRRGPDVYRTAQRELCHRPRGLSTHRYLRGPARDCRAAPISYNSSTFTVTLVPAAPLAANRFYQIEVVGTGQAAIRDIAGNLLDGMANGRQGSSYVALFGQGTELNYADQTGNKVSLKLSGGGYLQDVIYQGEGQTLTVVGERRGKTVLSGTVRKTKRSSGVTNLGEIRGLGNFGDVRVTLKTPPFLVKQYPFSQNGHGRL